MKKKDDIHDYCSAHDAAQILSAKLGRPIRPDYMSKMAKSQRHTIRSARFHDRLLYHKEDIANCTIRDSRRSS